jgi:ABC-2 type transport system permease protein
MTLLAVERIKLFSIRSPKWCMALAIVLTVGVAAIISVLPRGVPGAPPLQLVETQEGRSLGLLVIMVMAALAVTSEYRFGTIRASFQATPNRIAVLLAKTAVVGVVALIIGEIAAFASWALASVVAPSPQLAIRSADDWRLVAGLGLVFAVAAVLAVAVGILLRHTAGALSLIMGWWLLVESLVAAIPRVGPEIQQWMPFVAAGRFLEVSDSAEFARPDVPLGPWGSLAYFAAIAAGLLVLALVTAQRRDA